MSIGVFYLVLAFQERYIKIKRFLKYLLIPLNVRVTQSIWFKNKDGTGLNSWENFYGIIVFCVNH